MNRFSRVSIRLVTVLTLLFIGRLSVAADRTAADLLPASTLFYAEVDNPKDLLGLVLDHPLFKRLEQSPDFQRALEDPKFKEFRAVVALVEARSGVPWRKAIEATAGHGLAIAFDANTQGLILLARADDKETADKVRDTLLEMVRQDAKGKGNPDPIETKKYRGLTGYKAGDAMIGTAGDWTVISNKQELAKAVADSFLDADSADKAGPGLAADAEFKKARGDKVGNGDRARPTAWAFVRLEPLRQKMAGDSNPLFDKNAKSEDAGAELILGGLLGPLRNAPYATASLTLDRQHLNLALSAPNDPSWGSQRKFFFAPAGEGGGAAKPLRPKNTILSLSTYRDLAGWWAAGPDLLNEGAAAKMAQADSGLSTFLGGKSFGTDVLGALRPQIQFVAAAQDYKAAGVSEPGIKLPAFATVLRLKEGGAAQLRKPFSLAFQSIVTFANLDGASKGRPMLAMNTQKRGGAEIFAASYDAGDMEANPEPGAEKKADTKGESPNKEMMKAAAADLYLNFSPALVISKDHLILASTRQIAVELADLAAKEGGAEKLARVPENTLIEVSPQPGAALLKANREQLIAQSMLEKGNTRAAAEKEVDLLVKLVGGVKDAKIKLTPTDKAMTLELDVTAGEME
jgi:hypothetical protein